MQRWKLKTQIMVINFTSAHTAITRTLRTTERTIPLKKPIAVYARSAKHCKSGNAKTAIMYTPLTTKRGILLWKAIAVYAQSVKQRQTKSVIEETELVDRAK
jgi:hypothetical protein